MGFFSLIAVVLVLLLFTGGTDAARLYPTSQEFNNGTSSFLSRHSGLLQGLAASNKSGSLITYWALHRMHVGGTGGYYGFSVTMDVYDFSLTSEQSSLSLVHIFNNVDGTVSTRNSIEIGWVVSPKIYGGDSRTHLSAFWSTNGFQENSSCIDTNCPVGFQPEAGATIALGDIIEPVSQPSGIKQSITLKVLKDGASGDWLVHCGFNQQQPALIDRYPKSLFPGGLADRATHIHIGGYVVARSTDLVPMGSGYLPSSTAAASFDNFQIIDQNGQASLVSLNFPGFMSQSDTYSVSPIINGQFFYGGPYQSTT